MGTVASGNESMVYVAIGSQMTITPGAGGYVDFDCSSPEGSIDPDPRKIHSAETISIPGGATVRMRAVGADATFAGDIQMLTPDGALYALSEARPEVLANPTATTTVLTGAGEYSHYRCTTATGNITIYDNTAASGKVLVPTTALALGTFPIFGAGHSGVLPVSLGVTVVLSGAGVVYVGAQA